MIIPPVHQLREDEIIVLAHDGGEDRVREVVLDDLSMPEARRTRQMPRGGWRRPAFPNGSILYLLYNCSE
eukprot:scaffold48_cov311-Pinguiococcus_pyrenoidosus.AAC.278